MDEEKNCIGELAKHFKNINKKEFSCVFKELKRQGVDWQKIDFYSMGKEDTDYDIMVGYIFQEYGIETQTKTQNETQTKTQNKNIYTNDMAFWKNIVNDVKSIAIVGTTGSGKTALTYRILGVYRKHTNKDIYVYKHPKPELIKKLAYKQLYSLEELDRLQDVILWVDEPQIVLKFYENNGNPILTQLLSIARQRNITLILSTSVTQYITRALEGQIEVYCIKDLDYDCAKQGGRIRKIIKDNSLMQPDAFKLENNEYLFYCRKFYSLQGKYTFELPKFWNQNYSTPFRSEIIKEKISQSPTPKLKNFGMSLFGQNDKK